MRIKNLVCLVVCTGLVTCLAAQVHAGAGVTVDGDMLQELKRMIEHQQTQIDQQAAEIAALKEQLTGNAGQVVQKESEPAPSGADSDKMITSSFSNVGVSLYGHLNKAVLYGNDGDSSKWYFVDNINSQTRLGLKASVDTESGWNVGGRIEYGIVSNGSSDVNQLDTFDATSNSFKLRWAEVSFASDRAGKFSLGKGSSATDNTAEVDLSGTSVASYSGISDMAGGMFWYNPITDALSDVKIKNVFNDMDGLGRTDRIRYDTPSLRGFKLAASLQSGDAVDGALTYNRKFGETKFAAGLGIANPGDLMADTDMQYSGSASVLFPMGFNMSFSAAYRDLIDSDRDDSTNWWAKLGYLTQFSDAATTAFSIDYGETSNLRQDDETAKSWALAAVHNVIDWGTEFYLVYRYHQLDTSVFDFDDINTVMGGARLKF